MNLKDLDIYPVKLSWWDRLCIKKRWRNLGKGEEILSSNSYPGPLDYYYQRYKIEVKYIKPKDFYNPFNEVDLDKENKEVLWKLIAFTYTEYKYQIIDIYYSMTFYDPIRKKETSYFSLPEIRLIRGKNESFEDWTVRVASTFKSEKEKMEKAHKEREKISQAKNAYGNLLKEKSM